MRPPVKRTHIKETVQRWIRDRGLKPGDPLMGQVAMARHFDTTPVTVVRALKELNDEGILHRVNGKGTFVGRRGVDRLTEICLVLPDAHLDDPHFNPYWQHVQTLLQAFHAATGQTRLFSLRIVPPTLDPARVADSFTRYEAVFFHFSSRPHDFLQQLIRDRVAPVIAFGQPDPTLNCLTVDHKPVEEVRLAIDYLFGLGYRRIAYFGSSEPWCAPRIDAYREAIEAAGQAFDPALLVTAPALQVAEGEGAAEALMKRRPRCDAILCSSDLGAVGVVNGLRRMRIRVARDVGVMGSEGVYSLTRHEPHLTAIVIPYVEEISRALDKLATHPDRRYTEREHLAAMGGIHAGRTTCRVSGHAQPP